MPSPEASGVAEVQEGPLYVPTIPLDHAPAAPANLHDWIKQGARVSPGDVVTAETVDASNLSISDADLAALSGVTSLRHLNLRGTQITDAGLAELSELTQLEFLGLSQTAVTDAGLPALMSLSQLRYLTLAETQVTDRAVDVLSSLSSLEGLNLKGTQITGAGLAQLRILLPNCRIIVDESLVAAGARFERDLSASREPGLLGLAGEEPIIPSESRTVAAPATPEDRLAVLLRERLADPELLVTIGDLYRERNDLQLAVKSYREAVEQSPADPDLRYKLGIAEAELGDFTEARRNLTWVIGPAAAEYNLAVILHRQGRDNESRAALAQALKWEPHFVPAQQMQAWLAQPPTTRSIHAPEDNPAVDLVLHALRQKGQGSAIPRGEWKVAIRPAVEESPVNTAERPVVNRAAIGDYPVPVIMPLSAEQWPRGQYR